MFLRGAAFPDALHGYAVGYTAQYTGMILRTTNGGEAWQQVGPAGNTAWWAADFVDAEQRLGGGTAACPGAHHRRRRQLADAGPGVPQPMNDVDFVDARHGWAVGTQGRILRTIDGGVHWGATNVPEVNQYPLRRLLCRHAARLDRGRRRADPAHGQRRR